MCSEKTIFKIIDNFYEKQIQNITILKKKKDILDFH